MIYELEILPCLDSPEMGWQRQQELSVPGNVAAELGKSAVEAASKGYFINSANEKVSLGEFVQAACALCASDRSSAIR